MKAVTVSKHFKDGRHVGFRKFVFGRNFHLVTGTTSAHEREAKRIAEALVERAEQLRQLGGMWTETIIEECFDTAKPVTAATFATLPSAHDLAAKAGVMDGLTIYAAIERYKEAERQRERGNVTGHSNVVNNIYRIEKAKAGILDQPISLLGLPELKSWVTHFSSRPMSKRTGKPISAFTAAGTITCISHFLDFCDAENLWTPCRRWRDAFKNTSAKKLMTKVEKNRQKREGFANLTVEEAQVLWHQAVPDSRALFGLALWAGHTQNELATILLEGEFVDVNGELYLKRDRTKTGVWGEWWIPPEVAVYVRRRLLRTPRDPKANPWQVAFLTTDKMPLVHYGYNNDKERSDSVAQLWTKMLKAAEPYKVRYASFKFLRKTMAQLVRDELGIEFATIFCAQKIDPITFAPTLDTVQDQFYSNANFKKLEDCMRNKIYPRWKQMFERVDLAARLQEVRKGETADAERAA